MCIYSVWPCVVQDPVLCRFSEGTVARKSPHLALALSTAKDLPKLLLLRPPVSLLLIIVCFIYLWVCSL